MPLVEYKITYFQQAEPGVHALLGVQLQTPDSVALSALGVIDGAVLIRVTPF